MMSIQQQVKMHGKLMYLKLITIIELTLRYSEKHYFLYNNTVYTSLFDLYDDIIDI